MRKRVCRVGIAVSAAVLALLSSIPSQGAVDVPLTSPPASHLAQGFGPVTTGYIPAVVVAPQSGTLQYTNADVVYPHNVVSEDETTNPTLWDMRYCPYFAGYPTGWQEGEPISDSWKQTHPCPLFYNNVITLGATSPVFLQTADGTPKVQVGKTYEFYCELHLNMRGLLAVVSPAG